MKLREIFEVFLQLTCYQKKIRKDESGIINFQPSNCYGSHWVCYINKPYLKNILYFDSFGISPPEKIKKYLLSSGKNIAWNSTQLQMNSSVLCGHYCIYVIINVNRGKDFYDILYSFKQIPCRLNENRFAFARKALVPFRDAHS
jgi:hypothetical protein